MKLGVVIQETWAFFEEVYQELSSAHPTRLLSLPEVNPPFLKERVNRALRTRAIREFLRTNDVVFFEWASEVLASASAEPKRCGIVTRLHRYEMYRWADRIAWDAVDRVILVSEAKRHEFVRRFPGQAPKVVVIPEAISLQRFRSEPRPFHGDLGILCTLSPRKRVYETILAFSEIARNGNGFHLHVGGGPHPSFPEYEAVLRALVSKLGIADRVTFYGHVPDPGGWYRNIDLFLSNSYSEGLQVAPMEAIASGRYCLSHRWDGAEELLPVGALFGTEREFIEKVLSYSEASEAERRSLRESQLAMVRDRFDVNKTKVQIRRVIEEVGSAWSSRR
jgi:glycosyltransferase involved in cell wall biosynthesis